MVNEGVQEGSQGRGLVDGGWRRGGGKGEGMGKGGEGGRKYKGRRKGN